MITRSQKKLGRFSYETEIVETPKNISEILRKEFNINVKESHYGVDGTWYEKPKEFPVVFFDLYGYIIISSKHMLRSLTTVTKYVNIREGIHSLKEYKKFNHIPNNVNFNKLIEESELRKKQNTDFNIDKFKHFQDIMKSCIINNKIT